VVRYFIGGSPNFSFSSHQCFVFMIEQHALFIEGGFELIQA